MLRSLISERNIFVTGAIVVLVSSLAGFLILRIYMVNRLATDLLVLTEKIESHLQEDSVKESALRSELDAFSRTLYTPPFTTSEKPPAVVRRESVVEQWMVNRDKELRDRVTSLERRLFRLER